MDLHDGEPFWLARDGLPTTFPPLLADGSCEVAVVGGGITGALVALELSRSGFDVIVVDRRDVAHGSTGASTSLLQYEIDELLVDLADEYGLDTAEACYRECGRAIDLVQSASERAGGPHGFRRSPSVMVAIHERDVTKLQAEFHARRAAGFDVEWLDADELLSRWGITGCGGMVSALGGSVDPYALAHAALRTIAAAGHPVVDRTEVVGYDATARRVRLRTDRDVTISAKWCVIATGYEVERVLPGLPFTLNTTFAFVTEPIADLDETYPDGMLAWEYAEPYLYARTTDDGRFLVGGRDERYRDPLRRRRALPTKLRALQRDTSRRFPRLEWELGYGWAGTFAETPDGLAYIGAHRSQPRFQFALGFGGNGITYSALAAEYITRALRGTPVDAAEMFRLDRPPRRP